MENKSITKPVIIGLSLIVGMFLLGFYIFKGLRTFSDKDRVVTVKGLAEMNMTATSATVNLSFSFSGDSLQQLLNETDKKKKAILEYLNENGYASADISVYNVGVTDRQRYTEMQWEDGKQVEVKIDRYSVYQSLSFKSNDVKSVENKVSQIKLDLISKDLTSDIHTTYTFPELNSIKPKLIAESTKNARIAGEQFANDSQAELGKIKTASQGQISIASKYYNEEGSDAPSEPYIQKARVVSTIVFFLE